MNPQDGGDRSFESAHAVGFFHPQVKGANPVFTFSRTSLYALVGLISVVQAGPPRAEDQVRVGRESRPTIGQAARGGQGATGQQQPAATYAVLYRTATQRGWLRYGVYESKNAAADVARLVARDGYETDVREVRESIPRPRMPAPSTRPDQEVVTQERAREVFREMAAQKDIAFQFPADGCYARAHLMVDRMQKMGLRPHKAWTFANGEPLYAQTHHHPAGFVAWGYHVAPTLRVRLADGKSTEELVLDPSLFDRPATLAEWKNAQKRRPDSHDPFVRLSTVGKPPAMPHHEVMHGSGYWPTDDPPEELTHYSLRVMKTFKRFENHWPPKNLRVPPELVANRARAVGDRTAWLHANGYFFQAEGKNWVERGNDSHRFLTETARTPDYVELQDDSHKVQIRLTRDRQQTRSSDRESWITGQVGFWEDASILPLEDIPLPDAQGRVPTGEKKSFIYLGKSFDVLGPANRKYDSFAWGLNVLDAWVWPGTSVEDFDRLAADLGYRRQKGLDYTLSKNMDKLVLYGKKRADSTVEPSHLARQLADGSWSSKLGALPLIRHATPEDLSGSTCGVPIAVYTRARE